MPIYEYECRCGARFEELVIRSTDELEVVCRSCGGRDVKRQLSTPARAQSGGERGPRGGRCGPVG